MKCIIADDSRGSNAHTYIRLGYARALAACGHDVVLWDIHTKPAIDIFDEFKPDLVWIQSYNIERGLFRAILEHPETKIIVTASDWGQYSDTINIEKYPIQRASPTELDWIELFIKNGRKLDLITCHYHDNSMKTTHEYWIKNGFNVRGLPCAADISDYTSGRFMPELESDICFIGGYWPKKGEILDKWLIPLCSPELNLNIKIFGNRGWGVPQYCGNLDTKYVRHAFKSAKLCVNLSEPHAHEYGMEINERVFKLLCGKNPVLTDYTESLICDFFNNGEVQHAKTPQEFREKALAMVAGDLTSDVELGYKKVMDEHTYFSRVSSMFEYINLPTESENVKVVYSHIRKDNNL